MWVEDNFVAQPKMAVSHGDAPAPSHGLLDLIRQAVNPPRNLNDPNEFRSLERDARRVQTPEGAPTTLGHTLMMKLGLSPNQGETYGRFLGRHDASIPPSIVQAGPHDRTSDIHLSSPPQLGRPLSDEDKAQELENLLKGGQTPR